MQNVSTVKNDSSEMSQTYVGNHVECFLFLSDFSQNHCISTDSSMKPKYKIWRKFAWWDVLCSMQTDGLKDGRTEIHDGVNKENTSRSASVVFLYIWFILSVVAVSRVAHWSRYVTETKFWRKKFPEAKVDGV